MSGTWNFLLLFVIFSPATAKLSDILKTCRDVSCDPDDGSTVSYDPDRLFQWMAAGLPMIFWQAVRSHSLFNQTSLSTGCKSQLTRISNDLQQSKEWAYQFVDSSGKTPSGLLRATITAIGDYDQCLEINNYGVQGKYCMIDMHHLKSEAGAKDEMVLNEKVVFVGYPCLSALCVPAACDKSEIQVSVKHLLRPYMIKVAGDINCDTKESTSWSHRLRKLTFKQVISIVLVSVIIASVVTCTWIDLYHRFILQGQQDPGLLSSLSFLSASRRLFYSKPTKNFEILVHEIGRFAMILMSTLSHLLLCVESPLSYATIADHRYVTEFLSSLTFQFQLNDAALSSVTFLTGFATFSILFPMAKKAKLPYLAAIADRFIRFLPPILVLTAFEFIWPIIGNGPLYTRVADFNLFKCENNWIYNLFFVNNIFLTSIDICGGHSFYSSVDMQLFLLGLVGIFIFSSSEKGGIVFTVLMVTVGMVKMAHNAIKYETAFAMFVVNLVPHKLEEFLHYIYMQPWAYMPAFFTGFLFSYARMNGYLYPKLETIQDHIIFLAIATSGFTCANINISLRNFFRVYPDHLNWLFICLNRIFQVSGTSLIFVYVLSVRHLLAGKNVINPGGDSDVTSSKEGDKVSFNLLKAACRLSFSLYICNYLYIRTEFFTRRFLYPPGIFWIVKRLVSSILFLLIFSLLFHLLLLAPLDAVREHLMKSKPKHNQVKNKQHDE